MLETTASGVTELPFSTFLLLMQPIHLAIGVVEGLVTAAVVLFVHGAQPELLARTATGASLGGVRLKPVIIGLGVAALVAGVALSWFAATSSDGLEWSIARATGSAEELQTSSSAHDTAADLQDRTALLPDYGLAAEDTAAEPAAGEDAPAWPAVDAGTSLSGLVGGAVVAGVVVLMGFLLHRRAARRRARAPG